MGICVLKEVGEKTKAPMCRTVSTTKANCLPTRQGAAVQPGSQSTSEPGSDFSCHHLGLLGFTHAQRSGKSIRVASSTWCTQLMVVDIMRGNVHIDQENMEL